MALKSVSCHDGVGDEGVGGHDAAEQQRCHRTVVQYLYGHDVHQYERHKKGHKSEYPHLANVLPQVLYVRLQACEEHNIQQSHLAEKLEAGIALQDVKPIVTDKNAGKYHTDDVRDTQLAHHYRCEKDNDEYGEEYRRGVCYGKTAQGFMGILGTCVCLISQKFLQNCKKKTICANN